MHDLILTAALAPMLIVQGRRVRRAVAKLPEPPGERSGTRGCGGDLRVLVLGDSSAAGVGARHQEQALLGHLVTSLAARYRVQWALVARTGQTTACALRSLDQLEGQRFDVAMTVLSVNDVTSGMPRETWLRQQSTLRLRLRTELGISRLLVSGVPPMGGFPALPNPLRWYLGHRAERFDCALARDVSAEPGCRYLPMDFCHDASLMAEDGFHPGPTIYAAWGRRAGAAIEAMCGER